MITNTQGDFQDNAGTGLTNPQLLHTVLTTPGIKSREPPQKLHGKTKISSSGASQRRNTQQLRSDCSDDELDDEEDFDLDEDDEEEDEDMDDGNRNGYLLQGSADKKKNMSFTGCFTCRKRKVLCDKTRPRCIRCTKSKFQCDGFDIKLRWRSSIKFNTYGEIISNPKNSKLLDSNNQEPTFQRRKIKYLHYKEEYQYYDEMDNELTQLNKVLKENKEKLDNNQTWVIKKFGVMWGKNDLREKFLKKFEKKERKRTFNGNIDDSKPKKLSRKHSQEAQNLSLNKHNLLDADQGMESAAQQKLLDDSLNFNFHFNNPLGTEWISEELREDAIISATAVASSQVNSFLSSFKNMYPSASTDYLQGIQNQLQQTNTSLLPSFSPFVSNTPVPINNETIQGPNQNNDTEFVSRNMGPSIQEYNQHRNQNTVNSKNNNSSSFDFALDEQHIQNNLSTTKTSLGNDNNNNNSSSINNNNNINNINNNNNSSSNIFSILFHTNDNASMQNSQSQLNIPFQNSVTQKPPNSSTQNITNKIVPFGNSIAIQAPSTEAEMPSVVLKIVPSEIPEEVRQEMCAYSQQSEDNLLKDIPTTGLMTTGFLRFLLNYYLEKVANMMTVIPLPNNPWKHIYLPRALKGLGDLVGLGYTSNSRNCLLNALMAVSCFNIQSEFPKESTTKAFFLQLGIKFRAQAVSFLDSCLNSTVEQEKYKDVLTALLSMNTIDVIWGTMGDCSRHLDICEAFILKRIQERPKISEKAKSLHKVFSFLRLIQNSTALENITADEIAITDDSLKTGNEPSRRASVPATAMDRMSRLQSINHMNPKSHQLIKTYSSNTTQSPKNDRLSSCGSTPTNSVSTNGPITPTPLFQDFKTALYSNTANSTDTRHKPINYDIDDMYGLPNSLVLLFSDCVNLVRHKIYYEANPDVAIPQTFEQLCKDFEKKLFKWRSEWTFFKPDAPQEFLDDIVEALYYHQNIFYNAIIIYYFTIVRNVNCSILEKYCALVLESCVLLLRSIKDKKVPIVPVIWGAFIGGCAATEEKQHQYKQWFQDLADSNKFSKYWLSRQIMMDVFRRRDNGENNDNWVSVVKEWGVNIMLS
ncbi:hypothetical protein ACO0RG_002973 [Hanseniaspora osmophila]